MPVDQAQTPDTGFSTTFKGAASGLAPLFFWNSSP